MQAYQLVVDRAGWTPGRYEEWMASTIGHLLPPGKRGPTTRIPDAPEDTWMMGDVHNALRRDLDGANAVLSTTPYPEGAQRTAVRGHVSWMRASSMPTTAARTPGCGPWCEPGTQRKRH
jgi:hypothetical protein